MFPWEGFSNEKVGFGFVVSIGEKKKKRTYKDVGDISRSFENSGEC